jgi:hypothetical protein
MKWTAYVCAFFCIGTCNSSDASADAVQEIDSVTTLSSVLEQRGQDETNILIEGTLIKIPVVAERVSALKADLDQERRNHSICVAGVRGSIGKSAFVCNDNDFAIMLLVRQPNETISSNLRYIEEFAGEPLKSALSQFIKTVSSHPLNNGERDCVRLILKDAATGATRTPAIVLVRPTQMILQGGEDEILATCLQ